MSGLEDTNENGRAFAARPLALFVYGTLAPGEVNAHVLEALQGSWTPAKVSGTLCDAGWGAAHGFPGLRLHRGKNRNESGSSAFVTGLVFESVELAGYWPALDKFEGADYRCELTEAECEDGSRKRCVVYAVDVIEA